MAEAVDGGEDQGDGSQEAEEHGEVGREVVEYGITEDKYIKDNLHFPPHRRRYYLERIRKELVQVAADCVAWIEAIDEQLKELT